MNRITGSSQAENHNGIYIVMVFHTFDWGGHELPKNKRHRINGVVEGHAMALNLMGMLLSNHVARG